MAFILRYKFYREMALVKPLNWISYVLTEDVDSSWAVIPKSPDSGWSLIPLQLSASSSRIQSQSCTCASQVLAQDLRDSPPSFLRLQLCITPLSLAMPPHILAAFKTPSDNSGNMDNSILFLILTELSLVFHCYFPISALTYNFSFT